jgi:hypothetical protein
MSEREIYEEDKSLSDCCGDCIYNVFIGSVAVCAQDMSLHKKETCRFYEQAKPNC